MDLWALISGLNWTHILEQTIAGLICVVVPLVITFIVKKFFFDKRKKARMPSEEISKTNLRSITENPLLVSLFFTLFMAMLTIFALFILGENLVVFGLLLVTMVLGVITCAIFENQCPNCNRILTKKLIKKDIIKEEQRPHRYQESTIYKYADGSFKEQKYIGDQKTIMETWRTEKEFYECQKCGYNWDKLLDERNLDINNRPKPNIVITRTKPPIN